MASGLSMTSPTQLRKRIDLADQYEENELPSLPSIPPPDSPRSEDSFDPRPLHPYDVGLRDFSQNTPFVPRTHSASPITEPQPNPSKTPAQPLQTPGPLRLMNANLLSGRSTSHLTSTPATILHDRKNTKNLHQPPNIDVEEEANLHGSEGIPSAKFFGVTSPEASRIVEDRIAQSLRENMILMSTSGSENEAQRKSKSSSSSSSGTTRPEDFRSPRSRLSEAPEDSDESGSNASKRSLHGSDLFKIDEFLSGMDLSLAQEPAASDPIALPTRHLSSLPFRSSPSPARSHKSSSQSTLIAKSPEPDGRPPIRDHPPHFNEAQPPELKQSATSHLSSPGIGRRDSPRHHASYSLDEFASNSLGDMGSPVKYDSNEISSDRSPTPPEPEKIFTPDKHQRNSSVPGPSGVQSNHTRRQTMLSTLKAVQPTSVFRSAKRAHVPRRLAEAADDTSELSGIPARTGQASSMPEIDPAADVTLESDSTAHDLTTHVTSRHANGNTSFPTDDKSHRFNGPKLNSYMHSLNTRLSEENQNLCDTLATANDEIGRLKLENERLQRESQVDPSNRNLTAHRAQATKVPELEREVQRLQTTIEQQNMEMRELRQQILNNPTPPSSERSRNHLLQQISNLNNELSDANAELKDREDQIADLQSKQKLPSGGRASVIASLQDELAEVRAKLVETESDLEVARAKLEDDKESFATKIASVKSHIGQLMSQQDEKLISTANEVEELRQLATSRLEELNQLRAHFDQTVAERENQLRTLKSENAKLENLLEEQDSDSLDKSSERRLNLLQKHVADLHNTITMQEKAAQDAKFHATKATEQSHTEIQRLQKRIEELQRTLDQAAQELADSTLKVQQLEEALGDTERMNRDQDSELVKLRSELDLTQTKCTTQTSTIQNLEAQLSQALEFKFAKSSPNPSTPHRKILQSAFPKHRAQEELAQAYDEIARLKAQLATPSEKAESEILNLKIKSLEAHRVELEGRVRTLRQQASAIVSTPGRSPAHSYLFKSIIGLQTPKSPNQMLANMTTFINDASLSDTTIAPMLSHIHQLEEQAQRLREQLNFANQDVDDKLAKLAVASEGAVGLAAQLSESRSKVKDLETQLERLVGSRGTINQVKDRLSDVQCPSCDVHFDANQIVRFRVIPELYTLEISLPSGDESMTGDTENKTADTYNNSQLSVHNIRKMNRDMQQLRDDLQTKTQHLEELLAKQESEEQTLAQLREELNQTQEELNTVTGSLEEQEARCHQAEAECNRMHQEKDAMEERLRKTEVELSKAVNVRDCTAAELRALQNHKGEADGLSRQLSKAQATIDSLEEEKDSLGQQIDDLRHQIEHQSDLIRNSERKSVGLQRSVDEQHRELTDLRGTLEMKTAEIVRLRDLKDDVLNQAENLRDDLLQVRNEAEELAHDLQTFKQQQRQSNNPSARASAKEVVKLREELLSRKKQMAKLMDDQEKHVCSTEPRTLSVADQKKHSAESKGLLLRIRFLKLLFTRESYFRADLAAQKHMLLTKLGQTEIRNEAIQLALDNFGLPSAVGQAGNFTIRSDERSFKGVAMAVRAVCKLKLLSQKWKEEERAKQKLKDAYQKVRGKAFEA